MKIEGSRDCGNSPKNRFVQEFTIAIESGEMTPGTVSETVEWEGHSTAPIVGADALLDALKRRKRPEAIMIEHAISHGKVGASSGVVVQADGKTRRFAYIFEFTNTKANCVARVRSYA